MHRKGICLTYEEFKAIKSKFTARSVGFGGAVTSIQCYESNRKEKKVYVAHAMALSLFAKIKPPVKVDVHIEDGADVKLGPCSIVLKPHQVPIDKCLMDEVFTPEKIANGEASCNMQVKAGLGKTFMAANLIHRFHKKTLIIGPANLGKQWCDVFAAVMPGAKFGWYMGTKKLDGDVIYASPDALKHKEMTFRTGTRIGRKYETKTMSQLEWFSQFGFTVIDEVHTLCTGKRSKIFRYCRSLRTLAMSATCNHRLDKMDKVAHKYFGKVIDMHEKFPDLDSLILLKDIEVKVHKVNYHGPDAYTELLTTANGLSHPLMVNQFTKDPWRNEVVILKTIELYDRGHCVFIFLDRTNLIDQFVLGLRDRIPISDLDIADGDISAIHGKKSKKEIDKIKKHAKEKGRVCFITYGCGATGLSYDRYTAMIVAHPRRNGWLQTKNRIFRLNGPQDISREFVYICDARTPTGKQYSGFKSAVKKENPNAQFFEENINYDDIEFVDEPIGEY